MRIATYLALTAAMATGGGVLVSAGYWSAGVILGLCSMAPFSVGLFGLDPPSGMERYERRRRRNLRRSGWQIGCPSGRHGDVGRCGCTEEDM